KPRSRQSSIANDFPEANIKIPQYIPSTTESGQGTIVTDELTPEQLLNWSVTDETQNAQGE
ncbi:MAG: hypothetical protein V4485_00970, partial [Pseudomonadota bacterium]